MKILILLMSCNKPLYESEEQACRDTFLKDAEGENISYYFYKGLDDTHSASCIDEEAHTIYLDVNDGLGGTGKKTAMAFKMTKDQDYDYLIKTNVSTYLNIRKVMEAVNSWQGKDDLQIYGGRFLINKASKNIPFPRGYFTVISKKLVDGIINYAESLSSSKVMPRTDDTLISLCLLFHLNKNLATNYPDQLMEVPSVTTWHDDIEEDPMFSSALAIRCKDEKVPEETAENMRKTHMLVKSNSGPKRHYMPAEKYETGYGIMSYNDYLRLSKILDKIKELVEKK